MKCLVYRDEWIKDREYNKLLKDFTALIEKHTGITPEFTTQYKKYIDYPIFIDNDGDFRPTEEYLRSFDGNKHDHVFILIHEDNWKSDPPGPNNGIWGTAYAYTFGDWFTHYCRFDRDNAANRLGTVYHEWMHVLDAMFATELGVSLEDLVDVDDWDKGLVHGKGDRFTYIRHKENVEVLEIIKDELAEVYTTRRKKDTQRDIISKLQLVVRYLRILVNKKNGIPR